MSLLRLCPLLIALCAGACKDTNSSNGAPGAATNTAATKPTTPRGLLASAVPMAAGARLQSVAALRAHYHADDVALTWVTKRCPNANARALTDAIAGLGAHALVPKHYHLAALRHILTQPCTGSAAAAAEVELAFSDAFLLAATHLLHGRVDPGRHDQEWHARRPAVDMSSFLRHVSTDGATKALWRAAPQLPEYAALRTELARLRGGTARTPTTTMRIRALEVNLERLRWLPRSLGKRHVRVNVPEYTAALVDGDSTTMRMRAAVGRQVRRTPILSTTIRHIELNPVWNVPRTIATEDLLPEIRRDPTTLERKRLTVLDRKGNPVAPTEVPWARLGKNNFPYTLRQAAGPGNALGRVVFRMPNRFSVFLHDTPARGVFGQSARAVSSGCIRLENAYALAAKLLGVTESSLRSSAATDQPRVLHLPRAVPVHLLYLTATTDETGAVRYHEDIYKRDARPHAAVRSAKSRRTSGG